MVWEVVWVLHQINIYLNLYCFNHSLKLLLHRLYCAIFLFLNQSEIGKKKQSYRRHEPNEYACVKYFERQNWKLNFFSKIKTLLCHFNACFDLTETYQRLSVWDTSSALLFTNFYCWKAFAILGILFVYLSDWFWNGFGLFSLQNLWPFFYIRI